MKVSVGIIGVPEKAFTSHNIDCLICGPYETSTFGKMWRPTPCECEEACSNCDMCFECNEECEYYEWSLLAALKGEYR